MKIFRKPTQGPPGLAYATLLALTALATIATVATLTTAEARQSTNDRRVTMQKVHFDNHLGITIVGNIYLPAGFDKAKTYAAIITLPPAGGAKEQTAGLYARKMAENGFVTIAIDASFQGESGGKPRLQENPIARVEDVRGTVDYLVTLPYVDAKRIGVLGICAGGGYAVSAAMTERRISAVGVAVPVNGGREMRAGGAEATIAALTSNAEQRTAEARGGEPAVAPWIPDEYRNKSDIDLREGYQYYRTARGANPNWTNKMLVSSMDAVMAFDAFYLADTLLTQPLEVIIGSKQGAFGSNKDGHALYDMAASKQKNLVVMDGASHFDLYDNPKYIDDAVARFVKFYRHNLG